MTPVCPSLTLCSPRLNGERVGKEEGVHRPKAMPPTYTLLHAVDEEDRGEEFTPESLVIDLKQINTRLQGWYDKIRTKKPPKEFDRWSSDIHSSVFTPVIGPVPTPNLDISAKTMSSIEFDEIISSVRQAISKGWHPKLVTKGSSGSYFALNLQGHIVGIFKPKNEEPYGRLNPKWTKWLHRNLFPCFFGRSCLIPNLSYISEAAACLLDKQLRTYIVPPTDVVWLSSEAFNYEYFDKRAYTNKSKPLPPKQGSFQGSLHGI